MINHHHHHHHHPVWESPSATFIDQPWFITIITCIKWLIWWLLYGWWLLYNHIRFTISITNMALYGDFSRKSSSSYISSWNSKSYHPINVTFFRHRGEAHKSQARELSLKSFSQLRSAFLGANIAEIIAEIMAMPFFGPLAFTSHKH